MSDNKQTKLSLNGNLKLIIAVIASALAAGGGMHQFSQSQAADPHMMGREAIELQFGEVNRRLSQLENGQKAIGLHLVEIEINQRTILSQMGE